MDKKIKINKRMNFNKIYFQKLKLKMKFIQKVNYLVQKKYL